MHEGQQKALFLLAKCGDFAVGSTSIPAPGPGELLVKNGAIALNPVDWKIQKYGFAVETFPVIIGLDLAGIVDAVGEGVPGFERGTERAPVSASRSPKQGTFQQYTIAFAKYTAKVPQSVSIEQAASVSAGINTAAVGLYQAEQAGAGLAAPWEHGGQDKYNKRPFLLLDGASSVGAFVIQLAKLSGFSPIIATASPHNTAYLESLGATEVLDRHLAAGALRKEVTSITKLPLDVIYDAVSEPETQKLGYELLADNGTLVLTLPSGLGEATGGKKVKSTLGSPFRLGNEHVGEGLYAILPRLMAYARCIRKVTLSCIWRRISGEKWIYNRSGRTTWEVG
ncbi:GroES-like protein [Athelia psychrophila]|uniref:GroES-like protein n=1 Tax=Athelia psychrophila TaxID=1759441 RepID=A0A167X572_9AGAM|nr:GroES-like protein [Fibularhizoctonia sp. CBS 109695]